MTRKTQPPLQALIGALRKLGTAAAAIIARRKPDEDGEQPHVSVIDKPSLDVSPQPTETKTRPRKRRSRSTDPKPELKPAVPNCPHCRKPMVIKVARTGKNAGEFWGCVAYPKCRGIRPIFRKD